MAKMYSVEDVEASKHRTAFLDEYESLCRKHGLTLAYSVDFGTMCIVQPANPDDMDAYLKEVREDMINAPVISM